MAFIKNKMVLNIDHQLRYRHYRRNEDLRVTMYMCSDDPGTNRARNNVLSLVRDPVFE